MVECECVLTIGYGHTGKVLIDTWWNVNVARDSKLKQAIDVLIDTWWNVNSTIMILTQNQLQVLIDTWWNVNCHHQHWFFLR